MTACYSSVSEAMFGARKKVQGRAGGCGHPRPWLVLRGVRTLAKVGAMCYPCSRSASHQLGAQSRTAADNLGISKVVGSSFFNAIFRGTCACSLPQDQVSASLM